MPKLNKISVLLCDEEFNRFEQYCGRFGFKKSTLIARLIREHLLEEEARLERRALPTAKTTRATN